METKDWILKLLEYSQLKSTEFADEIDVPRASISHIISGRNKPTLEFIKKIKNRYPEIRWEWLINGSGEMTENTNVLQQQEEQDLFSLVGDANFKFENSKIPKTEAKIHEQKPATVSAPQNKIVEISEPHLEIKEKKTQPVENKQVENNSKVKKIVFFYDSGKFEIYENLKLSEENL